MLNGIAPIIIFNLKKLLPSLVDAVNRVPLLAENEIVIPLIPIPVYLKEELTGLYIQSENKSIDIETLPQTLPDGSKPKVEQRGINSVVTINMVGKTNSIGLSILLAMSDLIFNKVTSQEYSITYINKAVTVFGGLLESFSFSQRPDTDLYDITLQLSKVSGGSTVEKAATSTLTPIESAPDAASLETAMATA